MHAILLANLIGTHYIRSCNNKQQPWSVWKKRQEMNLRPWNPTEEGLASLHSVIFRPHPVLWKNALLYFATCKAFEMSFSQLFKEMGQFVKDPNIRWEYCLRAKRGQTDTSVPGEGVIINSCTELYFVFNIQEPSRKIKCT
jgi:hypothetical protein